MISLGYGVGGREDSELVGLCWGGVEGLVVYALLLSESKFEKGSVDMGETGLSIVYWDRRPLKVFVRLSGAGLQEGNSGVRGDT